MEPKAWAEILLTYGPYAVLAMFALWIAPQRTKIFAEGKKEDSGARALHAATAVMSWLIVGLMTWFIYQSWPPKKVYIGSLGDHSEDIQIYSLDEGLYVRGEAKGRRMGWRYAIVAKNDPLEKDPSFTFAFYWGPSEEDFRRYALRESSLSEGRIDLMPTKDDPTRLYFDHDGDPKTAIVKFPELADAARSVPVRAGFISAFAQTSSDAQVLSILRSLESRNRYIRAQARHSLSRLKTNDLSSILRRTDLSDRTRRIIEAEIRRKRQ